MFTVDDSLNLLRFSVVSLLVFVYWSMNLFLLLFLGVVFVDLYTVFVYRVGV